MHAIAPFLTGLGLFFCGVHFVSSHLVPLAGRRLRNILSRLGGQPVLAAIFGSFAGAITQSTNAVTSVMIGLVSAGMIDKRRAILIPVWSNVGLSLLVILVAVDLRLAASYLVALAGVSVYFGLDRTDRIRHAVGTLLGLGLLFIGMQMLKEGTEPLRDGLLQDGAFATAARFPALLFLIGAGLAMLCQSSSVASALAVAATHASLIDVSSAFWLVYGANFGAAGNYLLAALPHRGDAAQIAIMQVVQKLSGLFVVFVVLAIGAIIGRPLIAELTGALAHSPSAQVAWLFLLYQVVGALLSTIFINQILPLLERIAPPSKLQELSKPAYLIEDALIEPTTALDLVAREEHRLLQRLPAMLDTVRADAEGVPIPPATLHAAAVTITGAMARFLGSILESNLERANREKATRLQHRTANLNALYESLDEFIQTCKLARQSPSSGRVADQMIEALHALLMALADAADTDDLSEREMTLALLTYRDELMERIRQRVLREDPDMPAKAQEALFAATMLFERIIWLARRTALLFSPERGAAHQPLAAAL
ncbi:Na/Pi symporter [Microbacteriaceae bacterium K1510]|nr:Na/Pi symporter [Microbacteriaceae bacterium K1510]